jgi:Carbohydrate/starch-binding module (family 21)
VSTPRKIDQFVVRYDVGGVSFFDNNFGNNYMLDVAAAQGTDGVGTAVIVPNVPSTGGFIDGSGQLVVGVAVKNLDFTKQVGVVYTPNNWTTVQIGLGMFQRQYQPSLLPAQAQVESWEIHASVSASPVQFAVFYTVKGTTFWDNNFGGNFTAV